MCQSIQEYLESEEQGFVLLSTKEVGEILQIKPVTVQRWINRGIIVGVKLENKSGWRIESRELGRFIREHTIDRSNCKEIDVKE